MWTEKEETEEVRYPGMKIYSLAECCYQFIHLMILFLFLMITSNLAIQSLQTFVMWQIILITS